jgi:hypothetical protein
MTAALTGRRRKAGGHKAKNKGNLLYIGNQSSENRAYLVLNTVAKQTSRFSVGIDHGKVMTRD